MFKKKLVLSTKNLVLNVIYQISVKKLKNKRHNISMSICRFKT